MFEPTHDSESSAGHRFRIKALLNALVSAGAAGALLGLADFSLFDTRFERPILTELVLSKPSFWSLSFFAHQVYVWSFLAAAICLLAYMFFAFTTKKRLLTKINLPVTSAIVSVALLMFFLRVITSSRHHVLLAILFVLLAFLISLSYRFEIKRKKPPMSDTSGRNKFADFASFLLLLIILSSAFLAPDIPAAFFETSPESKWTDWDFPDVLLIVLDTVRADHLSCYGYEGNETPNIDRIAHEGLLFLNAYSTSPWTLPSHASMFTGLLPNRHRADWGHAFLTSEHPTLAEYLRGIGYRTAGFSENPFVGPGHGLARGFSQFHETWRRPLISRAIGKMLDRIGHFKNRREYANRTSGLLRRWLTDKGNRERPFFAYINLMAAHLPRYPRDSIDRGSRVAESLRRIEPVNLVPERFYIDRFRPSEHDLFFIREIYDHEISYLDENIGDLLNLIDELKIADGTILILTSDHGENFGEHGFFEHQLCLYDSLLHVPLIIRYPKLLPQGTEDTRFSLVGLYRTIADLVNGEDTPSNLASESWISAHGEIEGNMIIAEYANGLEMLKRAISEEAPGFDYSRYDRDLKSMIIGDYKYIWDSIGGEELFNLGTDPFEEHDIAAKEPDLARSFRQILLATTSGERSSSKPGKPPPIDDATRDALKALGYETEN